MSNTPKIINFALKTLSMSTLPENFSPSCSQNFLTKGHPQNTCSIFPHSVPQKLHLSLSWILQIFKHLLVVNIPWSILN